MQCSPFSNNPTFIYRFAYDPSECSHFSFSTVNCNLFQMLHCLDSNSAQSFRPRLQENVTMVKFCQNICRTPFPGGHSLVNAALMTDAASSGKQNLPFFPRQCLVVPPVSSVVSLFFMFFQALHSPLFQPLPSLSLHLPCLTRVLALSLFCHSNYQHIFSASVKQ